MKTVQVLHQAILCKGAMFNHDKTCTAKLRPISNNLRLNEFVARQNAQDHSLTKGIQK